MQAVLHILSVFAEITDFRNQPIANEIESLVDRIIEMKKQDLDTSRHENQIDQLVYRLYQPVEKVLIEQAVQKSQVQGTKKVQGRSVFRHTSEFELFDATQQLGEFQRSVMT